VKYGRGGSRLREIAASGGSKAVAAAYGWSRRTAQRILKGEISKARARDLARGPIAAPSASSKPYRERASASSPRAATRVEEPAPPLLEAASVADERPVREIVEEQKLVAGEQGAAIVDGVLCVTETTLKSSGVTYREIRTARFPELNQALANAHETVIRGNEGVPYAIVLGQDGRYYGVILGSNTDPGAIYDDEGYQALVEYAERESPEELPAGWEDLSDED